MNTRSIFLLLAGILIFCIGCTFIILYSFSHFFNVKNQKIKETRTYQVGHFNTLTNSTSFGFVKLPQKLRDDQFLTYRSPNNLIFSTISKISYGEFECVGTCSCENKETENRRSVNIFSKSVYFIVSAISLSLAVSVASKYFSEECFLKFSDLCSEEMMNSNVKFCAKKEVSGKHEKASSSSRVTDFSDYSPQTFRCYGHCLGNTRFRRDDCITARDNFNCEKKRVNKVITMTLPIPKKAWIDRVHNKIAAEKFRNEYLQRFCEEISKYDYQMKVLIGQNIQEKYQAFEDLRKRKTVSLCVANYEEEEIINEVPKNVECKRDLSSDYDEYI